MKLTLFRWIGSTWENARGLGEDLLTIQTTLNRFMGQTFDNNNQLLGKAIQGSPTPVPQYVSSEGLAADGVTPAPKWALVDLLLGVKNRLQYAHFVAATAPSVLVGRGSGSAGDMQQITLDPLTLQMLGTMLSARAGSGLSIPGFDGDDGNDGMPGLAGATGTPGAPGAPGAPGVAGAIGVPGQDGDDGLDGLLLGAGGGGNGLPGTPLSSITAALITNTIANKNFHSQIWNWALVTNAVSGITFGETTAATGGTTDQQTIVLMQNLATSTALPLRVTNRGTTDGFRVDSPTNGPFIIDKTGQVGINNSPGAPLDITAPATTIAHFRTPTYVWEIVNNTIGTTSAHALQLEAGGTNYVSVNNGGGVQVWKPPQTTTSLANTQLTIGSHGDSTGVGKLWGIGMGYTGTNFPTFIGAIETSDTASTIADFIISTRALRTDTAPIERMRVDSTGQVGIGCTPGTFVDVRKDQNATTASRLLNLTTGAAAQAVFTTINDALVAASFGVVSSTFTSYGALQADYAQCYCTSSWVVMADSGSGVIVFASGGNAERARFVASGGLALGNTVDAGAGGLSLNGKLYYNPDASVALVNGNNNDLVIPAVVFIRFTGAGAAPVVTGIAGGVDGRTIYLINTGTNDVHLSFADVNSLAANRIIGSPGFANLLAGGLNMSQLTYSGNLGGWIQH